MTAVCKRQDEISKALLSAIRKGEFKPGEKISPLRKLARHFGTSTFPVRQAIARLEKRGLLVRKHGSGIYVASHIPKLEFSDTVALALDTHGHIFGDLCRFLAERLHGQGRATLTMPWGNPQQREAFAQAACSGTRFFIFRGDHFFPFEWFTAGPLASVHLISVLECDCFIPEMKVHCAVVDHAAAGQAVAEHLLANGHSRLLVIGTPEMLEAAETRDTALAAFGHELLRVWSEAGGAKYLLPSEKDAAGEPRLDSGKLLAILQSEAATTAIVGLRDTEAWLAQEIIRCHASDLLRRIEIFGYGDTPWSRVAQPAFNTVNWSLEEIAIKACDIIEALQSDPHRLAMTYTVQPRLVLRRSRP